MGSFRSIHLLPRRENNNRYIYIFSIKEKSPSSMKLLSSTLISGILSLHQTKPGQKESRLRTLLNEKFDFDALFSNQPELEEPGIISSSAITLDDDPIPFLPEIDLTSCKSTCAIHKRDRLPCG